MKLRRRLILAMAAFLVIGLAVADVVTYSAVRSFLYGRLDAQLGVSQRLAVRYLYHEARRAGAPISAGLDDRIGPEVYVMVVAPDGRTLVSRPSGAPFAPDPVPVLPRAMRLSGAGSGLSGSRASGPYRPSPSAFDLSSSSHAGGVRYRAEATVVPQGTLVIAAPLTSTDDTLASLLRTELLVSLAVVAALCFLALWTVRRGLRPLDDMARTAGAIASGDLAQRVANDDPSSEVGRLGIALNSMLAQIEAAFSEKSASEARLRQFVADASHELRTPLTSIRGYAELLRKRAFDSPEDRERALGRVEREAARMGGLVDDLLLLARLDQGRPLERSPVDLRRICEDAVDDARLADPGRPVSLVAPAPVLVLGDRDRLAQVAQNLVRNALAHTPAATPVRVDVTVDGPMGVLRVTDEGPGLPAGEVGRVFDRFYRADHSRTGEGTGLGLSIVRAIADALGGRAWARSAPGQGSTFAVELPLAAHRPPATVVGPASAAPAVRGRRWHRRLPTDPPLSPPAPPSPLPVSAPSLSVPPAAPTPRAPAPRGPATA